MMVCDQTVVRPEAPRRCREIVSRLSLPAAVVALGAIVVMAASADTARVPHDSLRACVGTIETQSRSCHDRAAVPHHPAKGASLR